MALDRSGKRSYCQSCSGRYRHRAWSPKDRRKIGSSSWCGSRLKVDGGRERCRIQQLHGHSLTAPIPQSDHHRPRRVLQVLGRRYRWYGIDMATCQGRNLQSCWNSRKAAQMSFLRKQREHSALLGLAMGRRDRETSGLACLEGRTKPSRLSRASSGAVVVVSEAQGATHIEYTVHCHLFLLLVTL